MAIFSRNNEQMSKLVGGVGCTMLNHNKPPFGRSLVLEAFSKHPRRVANPRIHTQPWNQLVILSGGFLQKSHLFSQPIRPLNRVFLTAYSPLVSLNHLGIKDNHLFSVSQIPWLLEQLKTGTVTRSSWSSHVRGDRQVTVTLTSYVKSPIHGRKSMGFAWFFFHPK